MSQQIIKCTNLLRDLELLLSNIDYDKLFVLTDQNTQRLCLPVLASCEQLARAGRICIPAGDEHKNTETLSFVWAYLSQHGASRRSLLINLGGGMLTDLGGFAAASFKRGIRFINIPTTLLAIVDAAVGGKTGINFQGFKNEIGAFAPAQAVLIDTLFLKSLDRENFLSGYAEMIKHGILCSEEECNKILSFDLQKLDRGIIDHELLKELVFTSVKIKERIVEEDPTEQGIRKALNFGHTIGHAFESFSYKTNKPIAHGYAVAFGMVCELYLSFRLQGLPQDKLMAIVRYIKKNYGSFAFDCKDYDQLFVLMEHDKKNDASGINFTLVHNIGQARINQIVGKELIYESLDFYREYCE
ncbi:3-dehydroquinate synthase [Bacteroidales bacterium]|nr:3-dehydroquinate synthase [Bacteroidales bacterium]